MRKIVYIQRMEANDAEQHKINDILLGQSLSEEQAKAIFALGEEAVIFALLKLAKMVAQKEQGKLVINSHDDPSCPSGQKPVFVKPNKKDDKRKSKKPGRKKGHNGSRRGKPDKVDHIEEHRVSKCPDCGGKVKKCNGSQLVSYRGYAKFAINVR